MRKNDKMNAVTSAFKKDNTMDWKEMARKHIEEGELLKDQVRELESKLLQSGDNKEGDIIEVSPYDCDNWRYADRNDFELGDIDSLAEDMSKNGQLQPAIIRRLEDGGKYKFEVIAGERRWRACKQANLPLKAVLTDKDDEGCIVIQTSENKKRSLSAYSLAKVYRNLMHDKGISQNKMAESLGIANTTFREILSFNKVPSELWASVKDMTMVKPRTSAYIARKCEESPDYTEMFLSLAENIRQGAGVDALEKLISKQLSNKKVKRNKSFVMHGEDGGVLFRITTEGRVTLSKKVLSQIDINEFSKLLKSVLESVDG